MPSGIRRRVGPRSLIVRFSDKLARRHEKNAFRAFFCKKNGDKSPASLQRATYRCYLPVLAGLGGAGSAESVPKRREGDSNPRRLLTLHDFQSCTFDHSDISPNNKLNISKRLMDIKCITKELIICRYEEQILKKIAKTFAL